MIKTDKLSFHILRIGLGITFLWIGIMIFMEPEAWGGYLQPWAAKLLPIPVEQAMLGTAALDAIIGVLLLTNLWTWLVALAAVAHIITVLITSGITDITVRDIGLLAGAIALITESSPLKVVKKIN
ncbi:MAG: hypothetical protein A3I89_00390 [Candidatus Harrisonbacteria bacterium RIFCSPLOWO2_02_FULL_41_11]|uniref:DoxX family protein n=1 Tax=Candidatus Harrisonbacteria bacterium RIFCSPHIGHO2_02_FULL_42_16 TaxID=1798404 RepID=A0A1G1ZIR4_9BACT|nr:MAG: hypothetical protein A3B92_02590 [Candidatus Harrisonbacteria bacterium RIFCSPHIGHO2_02_FULL_42_16]OGY67405.1 MAG: hypothetical protein A3I89_00390 [Candidatus Harrisonbacteria bacterium RIFCSPLOWO2_02_FULL_41_11]